MKCLNTKFGFHSCLRTSSLQHILKLLIPKSLPRHLKDWHCSYDNLLNVANIPTLASRRQQLKLCQLFNIINGYSAFQTHQLPEVCLHTSPVLDQQTQPHSLRSLPTPLCFRTPFSPLQLVYGIHYPRMFVRLIHSLPLSVL